MMTPDQIGHLVQAVGEILEESGFVGEWCMVCKQANGLNSVAGTLPKAALNDMLREAIDWPDTMEQILGDGVQH